MHTRANRGFSLIELMVVIVIIGLLAGVVAVNLMSTTERGRRTAALADLKAIGKALKFYRLATGRLPESLEGLFDPVPGYENGVLESLRDDPWGTPYKYERDGRRYRLRSYGADTRRGGEGADADIWEPPKRT